MFSKIVLRTQFRHLKLHTSQQAIDCRSIKFIFFSYSPIFHCRLVSTPRTIISSCCLCLFNKFVSHNAKISKLFFDFFLIQSIFFIYWLLKFGQKMQLIKLLLPFLCQRSKCNENIHAILFLGVIFWPNLSVLIAF